MLLRKQWFRVTVFDANKPKAKGLKYRLKCFYPAESALRASTLALLAWPELAKVIVNIQSDAGVFTYVIDWESSRVELMKEES